MQKIREQLCGGGLSEMNLKVDSVACEIVVETFGVPAQPNSEGRKCSARVWKNSGWHP